MIANMLSRQSNRTRDENARIFSIYIVTVYEYCLLSPMYVALVIVCVCVCRYFLFTCCVFVSTHLQVYARTVFREEEKVTEP